MINASAAFETCACTSLLLLPTATAFFPTHRLASVGFEDPARLAVADWRGGAGGLQLGSAHAGPGGAGAVSAIAWSGSGGTIIAVGGGGNVAFYAAEMGGGNGGGDLPRRVGGLGGSRSGARRQDFYSCAYGSETAGKGSSAAYLYSATLH